MNYWECKPRDRDQACDMFIEKFTATLKAVLTSVLTFVNACFGIGKTHMMCKASLAFHDHYKKKAVTFLISPNAMLGSQLLEDGSSARPSLRDTHTVLNIADCKTISAFIKKVLQADKPLIFFPHIGHRDGEFTKDTDHMKTLMEILYKKNMKILCVVDELHISLTSLTGGLNANVYHNKNDMETYGRVRKQETEDDSLNLFDFFKKCNVYVITFSGTLNNVICSKLPSIGYNPSELNIWNIYPIEALCENQQCKSVDTWSFDAIASYIDKAEKAPGKILLVFSKEADINKFKTLYAEYYGRPMPSMVEVTSKTMGSNHKATFEAMKGAKYICGINLVVNGFNLATHVKHESFTLGILFRPFSDKTSQPLGSAFHNDLYMECSASLMQVLARLRGNGVFLIPESFGAINLYKLQEKLFGVIKRGYTQFESICVAPEATQPARFCQTVMLALTQLGEENLGPVTEVLDHLRVLTDLDFMEIAKRERLNPTYWTQALRLVLDQLYELKCGTKEPVNMSRFKTRLSGAGERCGREVIIAISEIVERRANGKCGHCGKSHGVPSDFQMCHFKQHCRGGTFTLDNLMYGHRACDAMFDAGEFRHNPAGGFIHRSHINFQPDEHQLSFIHPDNILDRCGQYPEPTSDFISHP